MTREKIGELQVEGPVWRDSGKDGESQVKGLIWRDSDKDWLVASRESILARLG